MQPYQIDYLNLLAQFYLRNNQCDRAATLWALLLMLQPDHPQTALALAFTHLRRGAYHDALSLARRYTRNALDLPLQIVAYYVKTRALYHLGEVQQSRYVARILCEKRKQYHG
ncbi:hypothetical protein [Acanthopleuribacter pedis]|uniref:Uncharacterized protein n=1 Tax=Acanthopleuribacter pedis TaxID=442870 RepID=A0A8J7U7T1_9BACT|nr:hypothetical protein [Acanthopleuribacter pedis]MBO1323324.1 hypothetical protein [Acanthopleuribacter pedis]